MVTGKFQKTRFTSALMDWHLNDNTRSLPWKNERDPYRIWLSEIILQQTRALQGLPYYLNFLDAYPTVQDLAAAEDGEVFRLWQGLGYYNRCRNMLATARLVVAAHGGGFPETHQGLLALKGVGPYTAAAISSFAFGLPQAVVDGNVYRVLARYFGIYEPYDTSNGKKVFATLAQELLFTDDSRAYNQAIMDLGATVCMPANPKCTDCPLLANCFAAKKEQVSLLPVKSKKQQVRDRFFNYIVFQHGDWVWVHMRSGNDIWQNLYQPYLVETERQVTAHELLAEAAYPADKCMGAELDFLHTSKQRLSHQLIHAQFYKVLLPEKVELPVAGGSWVRGVELKKLAFPKTLVSFLENYLYF